MKETSTIWPQDIQAGDSMNTRQFSLQVAAHLRYNNIMVDSSVRNNLLFCNIFANLKPNTCNHCNSTLRLSGFCPSIVQKGIVDVHNMQDYKDNKSSLKIPMEDQEYIIWEKKYVIISMATEGAKPLGVIIFVCKKDHSQRDCPLSKNEEGQGQIS